MTDPVVKTPPAAPEPDDAGEIRNDQDALKAVEALLAAPSSDEAEKPVSEPAPDEIPADLTSLAERLKATPDKLYALKVPMADGAEPVTLGQLKDGYRTADQLRVEREQFHVERTRLETDKRQALTELREIIERLPPQAVTPEAVAAIREEHGQRMQAELAKLLEAVPDWKDPVKWAGERPQIEAYAKDFGYTPDDLAQVTDHRVLRLLRTAHQMAKELEAERVKPPAKVAQAPKPGKQPSAAQEFGRLKAAVTTRRMSPEAAVAQLLKDSGYGR